jgi:hypothetical protein
MTAVEDRHSLKEWIRKDYPYYSSETMADLTRQRWRCIECLNDEPKRTASIPTGPRAFSTDRSHPSKPRVSSLHDSSKHVPLDRVPSAPRAIVSASIAPRSTPTGAGQQASSDSFAPHDPKHKPPLFDGGADQQRASNVLLHREHNTAHEEKSTAVSLSEGEPMVFSADQEETAVGIKRQSQDILVSTPSMIHDNERTEIPNTPTQRSSSLNLPSSVFKPREPFPHKMPEHGSSAVSLDSRRPQTITSGAVLCSKCQKQRVLAKQGVAEVIW